jgi:hypothetical protein
MPQHGPRRWTRQPIGYLGLDSSSRFNQELAFHTSGRLYRYDLATYQRGTGLATSPWSQLKRAGEHAIGRVAQDFTKLVWADHPRYDITGNFTFAIRIMRIGSNTSTARKIFWRGASGSSLWITRFSSEKFQFFYRDSSSVDTTVTASANTSDTRYDTYVVTFDGANLKLYTNGKLDATAAATGFLAANAFEIKAGEDFSNPGASCAVSLCHLVKRAWTDAEVKDFSRNPWQVYLPKAAQNVTYVAAGGSTDVTVSTPGTLSLTGVTLAAAGGGSAAIATPGTLTLTGIAMSTVAGGSAVVTSILSLLLTEVPPTVVAGGSATVTPGTLGLEGITMTYEPADPAAAEANGILYKVLQRIVRALTWNPRTLEWNE